MFKGRTSSGNSLFIHFVSNPKVFTLMLVIKLKEKNSFGDEFLHQTKLSTKEFY